jgi:membrane protein required for colicin V production
MTGFDIIVLLIVGVAAIGGFMRGFVQEVLSLLAWILAIFAVRYLHTDLTVLLGDFIGAASGAAVLAFILLLLIPLVVVRLIAGWAGRTSRRSLLGPIDRVLGFGFGAVKGAIVVVFAFSLLVLGYDSVWGPAGRPTWMTTARTYPFVNASADALVQLIRERQLRLLQEEEGIEGHTDPES